MPYLEESLSALEVNERAIFAVCNRMKAVPDTSFLTWFPSSYGAQVSFSCGCLRVLTAPALPRKNNNSWAVIEQMLLWQRWFRLCNISEVRNFPSNQRFLVEIVHHSRTKLPFIPNTVEAHSYVNGLAGILGVDDNLSVFDYFIQEKLTPAGSEYCEITISRLPLRENRELFLPPIFSSINIEEKNNIISRALPCLQKLSDKQVIELYHAILAKDWAIRSDIPYASVGTYYPLRRRARTQVKPYRELLKKESFSVKTNEADGTFCFFTNAPFRSRDQYASDVFSEELHHFLFEKTELIQFLQSKKWKLCILQKMQKPDGDNIPFDDIYRILNHVFRIPLAACVSIQYEPALEVKTAIILVPSSNGNLGTNVCLK